MAGPATAQVRAGRGVLVRRGARAALFWISGVLLVSMGGAVVAAPVTLPLMFIAVRKAPTAASRWGGGIVAALTAAELVWAVVYLVAGEPQPAIWAAPIAVGVLVLGAFVTTARQARRSSRSPSRNQISTPSRSGL